MCEKPEPERVSGFVLYFARVQLHLCSSNLISMTPKEQIMHWITHDRSFEAGAEIFRANSKHQGLIRKFSMQGETKENREILNYQLSKLAEVEEADWRRLLRKPLVAVDNTDYNNPEIRASLLEEVPPEVRKVFRLREEFPFLSEKECPDELKILVADLLSSHDRYIADHEKLFAATTPEEIAELSASVVENYLENREIWDELNHFKTEGKPLGVHPVWQRTARLEELKKLSNAELIKLSKNIPTNISRIAKKLEEDPENKETPKRQVALENYKWEHEEVKKLLNLV